MPALDEATLVERQNKLWNRMTEIRENPAGDDGDMTAEQRQNWDAAHDELEQVSGDIERVQKMNKLEKVDRTQHVEVTNTGHEEDPQNQATQEEQYRDAFTQYLRRGAGRLTPEQQNLLERGRVEDRAQANDPDSAGGFLVPEGFRAQITETMKAFGGLMADVNVITTSTGNRLPWPTNNDTGNVGAIIAENTQVTEQDLTFGEKALGAHIYTSKLVRVPLSLLQDSAFDLDSFLTRKLGERIGRAVAGHIATGSGSSQPEGLTTNATAGATGADFTAADGPALTYDNLVDLEHSVNSAYRGNAKYAFNDQTLKVIRKLKDTQDRPLWVPIPAPGFSPTVNGYTYTVDDGLPAPAGAAKSIVFGDLSSGYIGRQVLGVQLMQLRERYADYLQVGFLAFSRWDSVPDDTSAYRVFAFGAETA